MDLGHTIRCFQSSLAGSRGHHSGILIRSTQISPLRKILVHFVLLPTRHLDLPSKRHLLPAMTMQPSRSVYTRITCPNQLSSFALRASYRELSKFRLIYRWTPHSNNRTSITFGRFSLPTKWSHGWQSIVFNYTQKFHCTDKLVQFIVFPITGVIFRWHKNSGVLTIFLVTWVTRRSRGYPKGSFNYII